MQHPSVDLPTLLAVKNFQGTFYYYCFLIQTSIFHLQTPTDCATEFACNMQLSLESSPLSFKKTFGLTCVSADPVLCAASGALTWRENEEEVRHRKRKPGQQTASFWFSPLQVIPGSRFTYSRRTTCTKYFGDIFEYCHSTHRSQTRDYQ